MIIQMEVLRVQKGDGGERVYHVYRWGCSPSRVDFRVGGSCCVETACVAVGKAGARGPPGAMWLVVG